jgi:hypothetical protein
MDLARLTLREFAADLTQSSGPHLAQSMDTHPTGPTLRRCRTREQGIALMTVGHAIEYLFQSRLIEQSTTTGAEREALAILLNANLSVYNEGAEVVPFKTRLRRWLHGAPMNPNTATAR